MSATQDDREKIRNFMLRPGMYVRDGTDYDSVVAFLLGACVINEDIFKNFQEWLEARYCMKTPQHWSFAFYSLYKNYIGVNNTDVSSMTEVEFLFLNVREFFDS